jgi:hypothetical protein
MVLVKGGLHWMQLAAGRNRFDGFHLAAVRLNGEQRARAQGYAVDVNRAGAALAGIAADMSAGEAEMLAQELDKRAAWLNLPEDGFAIHD